MTVPKVALCLPGGGLTGAMYQIGALAALEDTVEGFDSTRLDLYVGASSGASVAAVCAGGRDVRRMYRALLDPADVYFPLERRHVLRMDLAAWRRAVGTLADTASHGVRSFVSRAAPPSPSLLWEELDRLYDALPSGLFSLQGYERFLEEFFARRGVPNVFHSMPRPLRILAYDLDSGQPVFFGAPGYDYIPVARACVASAALPPYFSPVRVRDRYYIDAGAAQVGHLDAALESGADVLLVVNPMVPVHAEAVPTGHGPRASVRDKGYLWVANQAMRISVHALLAEKLARIAAGGRAQVIAIEPRPTDGTLFMYSPASFSARRSVLEYAYRSTREQVSGWLQEGHPGVQRAGWRRHSPSLLPPAPAEAGARVG